MRASDVISLFGAVGHARLRHDLGADLYLGDEYSEVGTKWHGGAKKVGDLLRQRIHAPTLAPYSGQMEKVAVIDLDGVVADVRHRLHFVESKPKDWQGFFAACSNDPVLPEGLDRALALARDHRIVYLSGRPESCRDSTTTWLERVGAPPGDLVLRAEGDRRPARITKVELVRRIIGEITIVIDDDPAVLRAMQAAGYPTLHADWMSDSPTLFSVQEEGKT